MLGNFFNPKSVAIVGASRKKGKIGNVIFRNFLDGRFKGKVYPVNKEAASIEGAKSYPSVKEIKDNIDLAVIATPSVTVPGILQECSDSGIKSVIIVSSGFSEIGEEGKRLEDECRKIVKDTGVRVMGPNCLGVYDSVTGVDTLFLPRSRLERPKSGKISIVSQSGAVGGSVMDWLSSQSVGVSKFVSYGNAIDVNEKDIIEYLAGDDSTRVVVSYIEGLKSDGKGFIKSMRRVTKTKPVVAIKAGKTGKGTRAAASHTGTLAGSAIVYSAAFRQSGMIEVDNWVELFDIAQAFSSQPLPESDRLLIVTNGGGFGVLAADEADRMSVRLDEPSGKMKKRLRDRLPPYISIGNPIDLMGDATPEMYGLVMKEAADEYDGILVILAMQTPYLDERIVVEIFESSANSKKTVLCCAAGGEYTSTITRKLRDHGIPVYLTPESAVKAFSRMHEYKKSL